jgi:hypothetical protein|tara:strand:+ start:11282 stop:11503 length:222 start_codon:yes stop_codon:yes gene_type:complete
MSQKVSIVLELEDRRQSHFYEQWIRGEFNVISYANLPDTSKLYEENSTFKKLVANVKKAQWERDTFINKNNEV